MPSRRRDQRTAKAEADAEAARQAASRVGRNHQVGSETVASLDEDLQGLHVSPAQRQSSTTIHSTPQRNAPPVIREVDFGSTPTRQKAARSTAAQSTATVTYSADRLQNVENLLAHALLSSPLQQKQKDAVIDAVLGEMVDHSAQPSTHAIDLSSLTHELENLKRQMAQMGAAAAAGLPALAGIRRDRHGEAGHSATRTQQPAPAAPQGSRGGVAPRTAHLLRAQPQQRSASSSDDSGNDTVSNSGSSSGSEEDYSLLAVKPSAAAPARLSGLQNNRLPVKKHILKSRKLEQPSTATARVGDVRPEDRGVLQDRLSHTFLMHGFEKTANNRRGWQALCQSITPQGLGDLFTTTVVDSSPSAVLTVIGGGMSSAVFKAKLSRAADSLKYKAGVPSAYLFADTLVKMKHPFGSYKPNFSSIADWARAKDAGIANCSEFYLNLPSRIHGPVEFKSNVMPDFGTRTGTTAAYRGIIPSDDDDRKALRALAKTGVDVVFTYHFNKWSAYDENTTAVSGFGFRDPFLVVTHVTFGERTTVHATVRFIVDFVEAAAVFAEE